MTMLAEAVDAVIGTGTHRDSHEVEIAAAAGKPVATMRIGNDSGGFAQLLAAIAQVAPGPRVAFCIEGSRSYGIGLARALAAAGLLVIECEQPSGKQRRGKGKSDPIDAHLAVADVRQVLRTPTVADARSIRRREDGPMSHVRRFDHVGLTVADLDVVTAFFVALGLEVEGRTFVEGEFLDTVTAFPAPAPRSSC